MDNYEIADLYRGILKTSRHSVDPKTEEISYGGQPVSVEIDGETKPLLVPTYTTLRSGDRSKFAFFHPLSENITRGKSEVFDHLHRVMMVELCKSVAVVGTGLVSIVLKPDLHRHFSEEQVAVIRSISTADDAKAIVNWTKLATHGVLKHPDNMNQWAVRLDIKRNGTYRGKTYPRVGIVSFPTYEHIKKGQKFYVNDSKTAKDIVRQADYPAYMQIMQALFPNIDEDNAYDAAYDGMISPFLTAFMRTYLGLVDRLNYILKVMAEPLRNVGVSPEDHEIDTSWSDFFTTEKGQSKIGDWLLKMPTLAGNAGIPAKTEKANEERQARRDEEVEREEPRREERREETRAKDPLPWEDEKKAEKPAVSNSMPWASSKGGGTVRDLVGEHYERERKLDEEERREREEERERRERKRRLDREEDDRLADERRRRREREEAEDRDRQDERRRRQRERERDGEEDYRDEDERYRENERQRADGKVSMDDILSARPEVARGTPTDDDYRDDRRGGRSRRSRRDDDYDDDDYDRRDRRDRRDRDYDRYDRRDRDYGRRRSSSFRR